MVIYCLGAREGGQGVGSRKQRRGPAGEDMGEAVRYGQSKEPFFLKNETIKLQLYFAL